MTASRPTREQQAIIDAYRTGGNLVIEAGAGTGKTSTLRMLAACNPRRRGLYVAYNKAIASDAKRSFPATVTCATAHSLAFRAVGRRFAHRLNGPRMPARQTAKELGITRPLPIRHAGILAPQQVARLVMETITRFCHSDAAQVQPWHVPTTPGLDDPASIAVLRQALVPLAQRAWDDLSDPRGAVAVHPRLLPQAVAALPAEAGGRLRAAGRGPRRQPGVAAIVDPSTTPSASWSATAARRSTAGAAPSTP